MRSEAVYGGTGADKGLFLPFISTSEDVEREELASRFPALLLCCRSASLCDGMTMCFVFCFVLDWRRVRVLVSGHSRCVCFILVHLILF
jgi:hypothetical protein